MSDIEALLFLWNDLYIEMYDFLKSPEPYNVEHREVLLEMTRYMGELMDDIAKQVPLNTDSFSHTRSANDKVFAL